MCSFKFFHFLQLKMLFKQYDSRVFSHIIHNILINLILLKKSSQEGLLDYSLEVFLVDVSRHLLHFFRVHVSNYYLKDASMQAAN